MATLRDAERAREDAAELLRGLGAHAISVEEEPVEEEPVEGARPKRGPHRPTFAVVAWFAGEPPAGLADRLAVRVGRTHRTVPLRVRRSEPFEPERSGPVAADAAAPE